MESLLVTEAMGKARDRSIFTFGLMMSKNLVDFIWKSYSSVHILERYTHKLFTGIPVSDHSIHTSVMIALSAFFDN